MQQYLVAAFLLLLMVVNGDHPSGIEQHQSTHLQKTSWRHEKHDLQEELFGSSESPALQVTGEKKPVEQPHPWTLRRTVRSAEELQGVCDCLGSRSAPPSICNFDIEKFGPFIINGTCFYNTQQQQRQRRGQLVHGKDDVTFPLPPFPDALRCEGKRILLLVSSGERQSLSLSNVPSVWMCPRSLGSRLQHLIITNVSEVKIAPEVLAHRRANFDLILTGMSEDLVFPQRALSIDTVEVNNVDKVSMNYLENILEYLKSPQVKVIIENASFVRFNTKSVVAPRVWVKVGSTKTLKMETQAVEALSSTTDSILHVSSTQHLYMETRAAIVNKLRIIDISNVLLMEESMVVMTSEGEVIMRDVRDLIAPERAIIVGDGAKLELSNVTLFHNSNRAILSPSPLDSVILRGLKVAGSNSTSVCLTTYNLSVHAVTEALFGHSSATVCVKFVRGMEMDTTEESGLVLCKVSTGEEMTDPRLCADPRCKFCTDPMFTTQSSILPPVFTHVNETKSIDDTEINWWKEPHYLGPTAALILLVLLLLLSYCFYRLHRRSKRATYNLPQTYRNATFPRTIITPDNFHNVPPCQAPHTTLSNGAAAELFVSHRVSHGPSLQQAALADQENSEINRYPPSPDTKWRDNHQLDTCQQFSSFMTPEDTHSISSNEMII